LLWLWPLNWLTLGLSLLTAFWIAKTFDHSMFEWLASLFLAYFFWSSVLHAILGWIVGWLIGRKHKL